MKKTRTILASSSPRRLELLKLINIDPVVLEPDIDENIMNTESVHEFVKRVSIEKGNNIFNSSLNNDLIISADTVVVTDNKIIGKPEDRKDAENILEDLSGIEHTVITGIALKYDNKVLYDHSSTRVIFKQLTKNEIEAYLNTEDYMDKAGGYAIQGRASIFIQEIHGCFFNVMGFPLNLFYEMLKKIGVSLKELEMIEEVNSR
ncbi:MAG: Maf family protein [Acidobacteriota bacterium]